MRRMCRWLIPGLVLVFRLTNPCPAGVTFSGIDGAVSWVWVEAEDGTMIGPNAEKDNFGVWLVSGCGNPRTGVECWFDDSTFACAAAVPATMDNARLYAHCSSYYTVSYRPFSIEKDGLVLGYIWSNQGTDDSLKDPVYWSQSTDASCTPADLGTLTQGDVTLTFREGTYNEMRFDGFFLTDGTMDLANPPITTDNGTGTYWMQRPTFTGALPVLQGPVTPVVGDAPTGAKYFINGTPCPGGFGTLSVSGTYNLEVRRADNRPIAGASFTLVATAGLKLSGIDGAVSWVWVEAENSIGIGGLASKSNFGLWPVSGYGNPNSPQNGVEAWFDGAAFACSAIVPVTMDNARLYAHCSSYYTVSYRPFSIEKDGLVLGYIWSNQGDDSSLKNPVYWSQSTDALLNPAGLGTLNQGRVTLTFREGTYNCMRFDGFFLTNGTMDLANPPITTDNSTGAYWMQRPTFMGPLPVLNAPVTPVASGAPGGAKYYINGAFQCNGRFGNLTINGTYHLEIRTADNNIFCGADFILAGGEELTLGHRILLNKGLQIQALVGDGADFSLSRFAESNFTTANFAMCPWGEVLSGHLNPAWIGGPPAPGQISWSRYSGGGPADWEIPYLDTCVNLQYGDEIDIRNPSVFPSLKSTFEQSRLQYPGVLAHTDLGGQPDSQYGTLQQVKDFIVGAQPDMVMFSWYPFTYPYPGGSQKAWCETLQKFRLAGLAGLDGNGNAPIPYAAFLQGFSARWAPHVPTESEMRFDQFSAWAFGYKFVTRWVYTTTPYNPDGVSIFFEGMGDAHPIYPRFSQLAQLNLESRNLGPALVRLQSADVRMKMGRHHGPRNHWYEVDVGPWEEDNGLPSGISPWSAAADPYMTAVSASNPGNCNTYIKDDPFSSWTVRLPGDVILGYFKPLLESFDGTSYNNQEYFMIVNGLTDFAGDAAACHQTITVDFNFGSSGITGLQRMRRSDGVVETIAAGGVYDGLTWTSLGQGGYRLILTLDGGTGDLFKYNTGAPFVGVGDAEVLPGDVNGDGRVTFEDFCILQNHYGQSVTPYADGDFSGDGQVSFVDFSILQNHYGQNVAAAVGPAAAEETGTSFCGGLGLSLIAGLALMGLACVKPQE